MRIRLMVAALACAAAGATGTLAAMSQTPAPQAPATLPESVARVVRDTYVSAFGETRYFDAATDLNGDGTPELIVHVIGSMACGTGGCPTLVFTPDGDGYRLVTTVSVTRPPIRVSPRSSNGWRSLIVTVAGGGARAHDAELPFNGRTYPPNASVAPARPTTDLDGATVLIPDFKAFTDGKVIK
ncbi:MAG: hypothetical protein R2752_05315 [Vicinamibacterales bacterium]